MWNRSQMPLVCGDLTLVLVCSMSLMAGGTGDDVLTGGLGDDLFVFGANTGNDTVTDFDLVDDILVLEDGVTVSGTSEQDANGDGTLDTILALDDGGSVTILGVNGLTDTNDLFV